METARRPKTTVQTERNTVSEDSPRTESTSQPTALEEDLVAYLDGELDDEASRRIERLLASDAKVRAMLQGLDRSWQLLDRLDRASPDEAFARSTLEMVAVAAEEDLQKQQAQLPRRQRIRWLLGGGWILAAGAAGMLAVALLRPSPNRQFLEDLPILENLDQYRQVEDIEFLRLLDREGLFAKETGRGS